MSTNKKIQILVIDDDPTFRAMAQKAATSEVEVTVAGSFKEVKPKDVPRKFDVIVLDYYLDNMLENLKGTDVAFALEATPILLTSSTDHPMSDNEPWSTSIRRFVPKGKGIQSILKAAKELVKETRA